MTGLTAVVLLVWTGCKLVRIIDRRRLRRKQKAFWERHDKNMEAIRSGNGANLPYPNNSYE